MININIITRYPFPNFIHQLDKERFNAKYAFFENSDEDIVWDMVVVYEGLNNIRRIKVKKGGLLFISGEPPMSSVYPKQFLNQFDWLITSHKNLSHSKNLISQQALNWHFGFDMKKKSYKYCFEDLSKLPYPEKANKISVISSSKKMMPGHNERMKLIEKLKSEFSDVIDFYGKDINPIDDKAEAILPYMFHICVENSFIDDYWTEKLADPILGYSIPIYIGCTNIHKYFEDNAFYSFNINEFEKISDLILDINSHPNEIYNSRFDALLKARNLILNQYNIFPVLEDFYNNRIEKLNSEEEIVLKPANFFKNYQFMLYRLRAKRFLYKSIYSLKNNFR